MMNKKGRQSLNERFIEAFSQLEEKGVIVRNGRENGISAMAEQLFENRSYGFLINKFLSGERNIPYEQAKLFCHHYGISEDYMFKGEEPMLEEEKGQIAPKNISNSKKKKQENILFSNVEALASSALSIQMHENTESFSIPGLNGGQFIAFEISGNSMYPSISSGDLVICKSLENAEKIVDNEVYAIVSENGVQVKRIQKVYDKQKRLIRLKMISDNYLEHDPFFMDVSQIKKIMKVERKLTSL